MKNVFILIALVYSIALQAQPDFDRKKMDDFLKSLEKNKVGMGSVSLFHKGQEVYSNTYGFRILEKKKKKPNDQTMYRIGSISKTFTATIILKLKEESKLDLEQTLDIYYPSIPNASEITLRNMLNHKSGIINFTEMDDYLKWNTQRKTKAELLQIIQSQEPRLSPNEMFSYSNSNYVLLALIAEDVTNKSFSELVNIYISKPCKLKRTRVGTAIQAKKNEAQSYVGFEKLQLSPETHMSIPMGGGGIVSTPYELNVFFNKLFKGELLSKESLEEMTQIEDGAGLGIFQYSFNDQVAYGHTGGIDGFQSMAVYIPAEDFSFAITSNAVLYPVNQIAIALSSLYFGLDFEQPDFGPGKKLDVEKSKIYLGEYTNPTIPLTITISQKNGEIRAQASGQSEFTLQNYAEHKFKFEPAGIKIEFLPDEGKLLLHQGGQVLEFVKKQK